MYYIGIYYSANNSAKRVEDYSRTRKHAFAYYYSDKSLEKREKVSGIKLIWYKYFKKRFKRLTFYCSECGYKYKGFVKSKKDRTECPRCEKD